MRRAARAMCALLFSACTPVSSVIVIADDLPEDITWVAFLFEDGESAAGTGLLRASDGRFEGALEDPGDASGVVLIGYTDEDLVRAGSDLSEAMLRRSRVVRAETADPLLPNPTHVSQGQLIDGRVELSPIQRSDLELTTAWLARCPLGGLNAEDLVFNFPCFGESCPIAVRRTGCTLDLESTAPSQCAASMTWTLDARGRLVEFESRADIECTGAAATPPALAAAQCSVSGFADRACRAELFVREQKPRFEVTKKVLFPDVEPFETPQNIHQGSLSSGYLSDLVVRGDRVVVSTLGGRGGGLGCTGGEGSLVVLDADTLEEVTTTTLGPCLVRLAPDPLGDGIIGVVGDAPTELFRASMSGEITQRLALPEETTGAGFFVTDLIVNEPAGRLGMAVRDRTMGAPVYFLTFDLASFEPKAALFLNSGQGVGTVGGRGEFVSVDNDALIFLDPETLEETRPQVFLQSTCDKASFAYIEYWPEADRFLLSGRDETNALVSPGDGPASCRFFPFSEFGASPWHFSFWPSDRNQLLVGVDGLHFGDRTAALGLLDLDRGTFAPGATIIGEGPVAALSPDDRGRVFGTLPWEAIVFRVDPVSSDR